MKKIKKVRLFVNSNIKSKNIESKLKDLLQVNDFTLTENDDFDLGIAIGGDGSFLRMVNTSHFNGKACYVGINAGTLGFAQDISVDELEEFVKHIKEEYYFYEEVGIEEVVVETREKTYRFNALNEFVIRNSELNTIHLDVYVEDNLLENYVGDGLLLSTSFGSTAYNLTFGGSIVYNSFDTIQITPIAPQNNKSCTSLTNSIIIPSNKEVLIKPRHDDDDILLTIDGNNVFYNDVVSIKTEIKDCIKIIRKKDYNFIRKINDKFLK